MSARDPIEFENLSQVWRREVDAEQAGPPDAALAAVQERARQVQRAIRRRDLFETIAALLVIPFFLWIAIDTPTLLSKIGAITVVAGAVIIPLRLRAARRPDIDVNLPLADALHAELDRTRAQHRLLSSMLWWYIAPLAMGALLVCFGQPQTVTMVGVEIAIVLFNLILWRANTRAVRRQLEPALRELESLIAALEDDDRSGPDTRPGR